MKNFNLFYNDPNLLVLYKHVQYSVHANIVEEITAD